MDDELDPGLRLEFDEIIEGLQRCSEEESDDRRRATMAGRALQFMGRLVDVTTNVADLIDRYRN